MVELFANSGDTDQTLHSAASDLGLHSVASDLRLHCLPFTGLGFSSLQWIKGKSSVGKECILDANLIKIR